MEDYCSNRQKTYFPTVQRDDHHFRELEQVKMDLQTTGAHRKYADRAINFAQEDLDANGHLKALGILRLFQNSDLWYTFRLIRLEVDLTGNEPEAKTFKCREIEGLKGLIGRTPEFTLMDGSNKVIVSTCNPAESKKAWAVDPDTLEVAEFRE